MPNSSISVCAFTAKADPNDPDVLQRLLFGATRRLNADKV
jgi:hypothetical protein